MVHTSMRSLGWVIGGADTVVLGLLDAVGADGTILAMAGAHNDTWYGFDRWPAALQDLYRNEMPAFDPELSESTPDVGRVPERIRTWPGAVRSDHPESSLVALGPRAAWLMDPHPLDFPSGKGSPLARLVEAGGKVLMLGAPLETITLLHHAETMAGAPDKRIVRYPMAVLKEGERRWVTVTDIDSSDGAYEYPRVCDGDAFAVIGRAALDAGIGRSGQIGASATHLFPAPELVIFAIRWIDERFGKS
jgi:aminoglycoside 3-N-acetyltransferase